VEAARARSEGILKGEGKRVESTKLEKKAGGHQRKKHWADPGNRGVMPAAGKKGGPITHNGEKKCRHRRWEKTSTESTLGDASGKQTTGSANKPQKGEEGGKGRGREKNQRPRMQQFKKGLTT